MISDLVPSGTAGVSDGNQENSPPFFTPTPPPTSSNTPTATTSPSYSPASTLSPHSTILNSSGVHCSPSRGEGLLLKELKNEFVLFRDSPQSQEEAGEAFPEMLPLSVLRRVNYTDNDNNNESGAREGALKKNLKEGPHDRNISSNISSSLESLTETLEDPSDTLIIQRPIREATSKVGTSRKSPTKDPLLSRMLATLSDFEDDLEPIDSVESDSETGVEDVQQKQILFDVSRDFSF